MSVGDWLDMMTQTILVAARTSGLDRYGNAQYGADVSIRCRIVGKRRRVIGPNGNEVTSEQTVYLGTADPVDPLARVTISTGDAGSTASHAINPPILATGRYPDEDGAHHSVIYL